MGETDRQRQSDKQTDRQTDGWTDGRADRRTGITRNAAYSAVCMKYY